LKESITWTDDNPKSQTDDKLTTVRNGQILTYSEIGKDNNSVASFQVETIDLGSLSIDGSKKLGVVLVQPAYDLDPDGVVPFRVSATARENQIKLIEKAFQIRKVESRDRGIPIPFILFPEAAIPVCEPDGLYCLNQQMNEAQGDVVFIRASK
jgi:hypothetical protein